MEQQHTNAITSFSGPFWFLDNFYPSPFDYDGRRWRTVEHAFQAMKSTNPQVQERIRRARWPGFAKGLGRSVVLRPDWQEVKTDLMLELVTLKFAMNPRLRDKLIATGDAHLEEGNNHGDRIWGTVDGVGENRLGRILMDVRTFMKENLT